MSAGSFKNIFHFPIIFLLTFYYCYLFNLTLIEQSDFVNIRSWRTGQKVRVIKDNKIIGNSRDREKVLGIEDFERSKIDCILDFNHQLTISKTMRTFVYHIIILYLLNNWNAWLLFYLILFYTKYYIVHKEKNNHSKQNFSYLILILSDIKQWFQYI